MTGGPSLVRVRQSHIAWADARLSERDRLVIDTVARLRLATGQQLEQACFTALAGRSRTVVRGRVLARLVNWRVLQVIDRRMGGAARGSASAVYALDSVGAALTTIDRKRLASAPADRFRAHTLAISQLYADLVSCHGATSTERQRGPAVGAFDAEPAAWAPDGLGGYLKPDAYLRLDADREQLHWWIEVDRATESLPTISRKLQTYLSFIARGQLGPAGVVPRVLITVPDGHRLDAIDRAVARLPPPADELFAVKRHDNAARALLTELR